MAGAMQQVLLGGTGWNIVYTGTFDVNNTGLEGYSFRMITPLTLTRSSTKIRVTLQAHTSSTTQFDHVSIGIRSLSTENTTAAPTELLFAGAGGVTIAGGNSALSDELAFSLAGTEAALIVICDVHSTNGNLRGHTAVAGTRYYKAATASYNVQSPAGFSTDSATQNVALVEIL